MARLLADENFPLPVVEALRRLGHDVVTLADAGHAREAMPDEAVLHLAIADGRAVITLDRRHFVRLHGDHLVHAGIVVCTLDLDFEGQARRVDAALREHEVLTGCLLRITRAAGDGGHD
ncbi:MAG: DUF5615 family PIN-like protein [Vicinamibacterales bacterium]